MRFKGLLYKKGIKVLAGIKRSLKEVFKKVIVNIVRLDNINFDNKLHKNNLK